MSMGKIFISEIGKYFKENDATSAMNQIMDITRTLNLSEKRLFAENGGYPPTQNGDIRSLFWLFSLMALQN